MNKATIKLMMSIAAFISAVIIGFIAMFLPPTGIIDASILWFTSQLLVFTATVLGLDISIDSLKHKATSGKRKQDE